MFCQECGQRLAPRIAAVAPPAAIAPPNPPPPAPPLQPAANPLGATALGDASPPPAGNGPERSDSGRAPPVRPQAPAFEFASRTAPPSAPGMVRTACIRCGAWNDASVRFCVSCGNALAPTTEPIPPPVPAAGAISPARVVPVTPFAPPTTAEVRVCARCRGACDASAQFCRFCGAPLVSTTDPAPRLSPVAPAPKPEPPPPPSVRPVPVLVPLSAPPSSDTSRLAGGFASSTGDGAGTPEEELLPLARLVVIAKDGGEGPSYPVGETLDMGRVEGDVIIAEDRYLSPRHARIIRRGGRLHLRDLGSTNGLYLRLRTVRGTGASLPPPVEARESKELKEGKERKEARDARGAREMSASQPEEARALSLAHPLRDQDLFLVGQQVLRFEVVNDADEGLGPASQHGTLLFGSPATPRYARLCQRTVEGVTRDVFYIRKAETVLGRESGDVVFTEDPFLSRRHATVRVEKDPRRFLLTDLGSSNGTFVQVRNEIALESGDQFRIGQQLFRIDIS